jgi:transposase
MTRALSDDLRRRVVEAVEAGMSRRASAERFGVGVATAIRWVERWRSTGNWAARPGGGNQRSHMMDAYRDEILALVAAKPDMTLAEISAHLEATHELRPALSTVHRFFERHGISYKKRMARPVCKLDLEIPGSVCVNVYGLMVEPMAKMDIRTSGATIKTPATSAIFLAGLSRRRSTVRPSPRSFLQTSLGYTIVIVRPI